MKQTKKKHFRMIALLLVLNLVLASVSGLHANVVKASVTGCTTVMQSVAGEKLTYQKVGSTYFGYNDKHIFAKKSGEKAKRIAGSSKYIKIVLTNGSKVYYQAGRTVFSVDKDGKNKKTVKTWKSEDFTLSGVSGENLYYSYRFGEYDFEQHTYSYNLDTKKSVRVFKNVVIHQQKGKYMTVVGLANDVSPVSLKLYNLDTEKLTTLCKEQSGASFVGNKVYYAKFISYDAKTNSDKYRIQYYDLNKKKTVKVKTIDGMQVVSRFTSNGCYYFDKDCNMKYYNYKTGKITKA